MVKLNEIHPFNWSDPPKEREVFAWAQAEYPDVEWTSIRPIRVPARTDEGVVNLCILAESSDRKELLLWHNSQEILPIKMGPFLVGVKGPMNTQILRVPRTLVYPEKDMVKKEVEAEGKPKQPPSNRIGERALMILTAIGSLFGTSGNDERKQGPSLVSLPGRAASKDPGMQNILPQPKQRGFEEKHQQEVSKRQQFLMRLEDGISFEDDGRFASALHAFDQALDLLEPGDVTGWECTDLKIRKAHVLVRLKKSEEAIALLREQMKFVRHPSPRLLYHMGLVLQEAGQSFDAIQMYRETKDIARKESITYDPLTDLRLLDVAIMKGNMADADALRESMDLRRSQLIFGGLSTFFYEKYPRFLSLEVQNLYKEWNTLRVQENDRQMGNMRYLEEKSKQSR